MGKKTFAVICVVAALHFGTRQTDVLASTEPPPAPWMATDIGDVGQPGSSTLDTQSHYLSVAGAGADIWDTADAFHFMYRPFSGDGEIGVFVTAEQNTDPHAKVGLMIRQSLDPGSPHVILDLEPAGNVEFMKRSVPGGTTAFIAGGALERTGGPGVFYSAPLRLTRVGEIVTANFYNNGWTTIGSTAFTSGPVLIGVAVTSHNPSVLNTATLNGPPRVSTVFAPWATHYDVGEVGIPGDTSFTDGTFTVSGAGSDIWGTEDSFHMVTRLTEGDETVVARVVSEENPNPLAKAGVMMRGCDAIPGEMDKSDATVVLDVLPNGEIEFMSRQPHESMAYIAGAGASFPVWLKIARTADQFGGFISSDGRSWELVGTTTVPMSSRCDIWDYQVGLVVTSHDPTVLNTAVFDRVSVGGVPDVVFQTADVAAEDLHGNWSVVPSSTSPNQIMLATPDDLWATFDAPLANPTDFFEVQFDTPRFWYYQLWLRLQATDDSKRNDAVWVQFSDAQNPGTWAPVYPIGSSEGLLVNLESCSGCGVSGWGFQNTAWWLDQPTIIALPAGHHTIRIQVREDGVRLDNIILSPTLTRPGWPKNSRIFY